VMCTEIESNVSGGGRRVFWTLGLFSRSNDGHSILRTERIYTNIIFRDQAGWLAIQARARLARAIPVDRVTDRSGAQR
jgi:hypothetical protein